ncbi:MAG: hypothetical protein MMC33_004109 [Icmadophila ericetorum]|nr:hypothetical protein [Icmadophila ericetorum]
MLSTTSISNNQITEASLDINAMLFDVSGRMARAQLARQISNSSATSMRRAARVLKVNSTGNSPQNITRRRASSTHRSSRHRPDVYSHIPIPPQLASNYGQQVQAEQARPVSWHPSTRTPNRSSGWAASYYAPARYSMGDHQNISVTGFPAPAIQSEPESATSMSTHYSMDGSSIAYQSTAMSLYEGNPQSLNLDTTYQSCIAPDFANPQYSDATMTDGFPTFPPNGYSTQTWAESLSAFPTYTTPPTPDFLPIQYPSDMWQGCMQDSVTTLPKKPSKELVGMGLYDDLDIDSFSLESALNGHFGHVVKHTHLEPTGKGLKLEETWQPPEEEDDDGEEDEDEDESEEEAKYEKAPQHVKPEAHMSSVPTATQNNPPTAYGDLSNQSFFFDNDDSYFDSTGFENAMPAMPPNLGTAGIRDFNWV